MSSLSDFSELCKALQRNKPGPSLVSQTTFNMFSSHSKYSYLLGRWRRGQSSCLLSATSPLAALSRTHCFFKGLYIDYIRSGCSHSFLWTAVWSQRMQIDSFPQPASKSCLFLSAPVAFLCLLVIHTLIIITCLLIQEAGYLWIYIVILNVLPGLWPIFDVWTALALRDPPSPSLETLFLQITH